MRSALDDAPFAHHQDLVRLQNCGEAVRDDDGSAAAKGNLERPLDCGLRFGIQMRGRLVQDDDFGRLKKQAGNGQALFLASREAISAVAAPVCRGPSAGKR